MVASKYRMALLSSVEKKVAMGRACQNACFDQPLYHLGCSVKIRQAFVGFVGLTCEFGVSHPKKKNAVRDVKPILAFIILLQQPAFFHQ